MTSSAQKQANAQAKTKATAERATANQAQAQARQGEGKSATQNKAEFEAQQQARPGYRYETLRREDGRETTIQVPNNQNYRKVSTEEQNARQTERQSSTSKFAYDEYGEASAGPVRREQPLIKKENIITFSNQSPQNIAFGPQRPKEKQGPQQPTFIYPGLLAQQPTKPEKKNIVQLAREQSPLFKTLGGIQEPFQAGIKDFFLGVASIPVAIGVTAKETFKSGNIITGFERGTKTAQQFYESSREPKKPGTEIIRGAGEITAGIFALGGISPSASAGKTSITAISRGLQISKAEKLLREPGIISGKEKFGRDTFLISKGTETKPAQEPFTVLRFGKKGGSTIEVITPGSKTLSPSEINIHGKLDPTSQKLLGVKQTGPFTFASGKTTLQGRQTFQGGLFGKEIKPIAEGKTASLKDLLGGKTEKLYEATKKPKSVYAETRAERFDIKEITSSKPTALGKAFTYGASKSSNVGAGQNARGFTSQESKAVKEMIIGKTAKPEKEILFASPRLLFPSLFGQEAQQSVQQSIQYPTGTKEKFLDIFTKTPNISQGNKDRILTPQIQKQPTINNLMPPIQKQPPIQKLIPPTKLFPPITKNPPTTKLIPPTKLFPPIQIPKQPQIQTPIFRIDTPSRQTTTTITPPITTIKPPPEIPIKETFFGFLPGPMSSRDYDSPSKLLGETKGFFGNVPQDVVEGIFGKRQDVTYSEGAGLTSRNIKNPTSRSGSILLSLENRRRERLSNSIARTTNRSALNISSKSNSISSFGSFGKRLSITSKVSGPRISNGSGLRISNGSNSLRISKPSNPFGSSRSKVSIGGKKKISFGGNGKVSFGFGSKRKTTKTSIW